LNNIKRFQMSESKIDSFFGEIKENLSISLNKLLTHGDSKPKYDANIVVAEILKYIKNDIQIVTQDNRYEEYYRLTGKAVTIAEAWLKNYSQEVKHFENTESSINEYISKTYGKKSHS